MATVTRTPNAKCLSCDNDLDAATGRTGAVPKPGDYSLCAYCGSFGKFSDQMGLEAADLETAEVNDRTKSAIRAMQKRIKLDNN